MPASASSPAVPPVETSSTPSSLSPRAKSPTPRLSETVRSARPTLTSPAGAGSDPLRSAGVATLVPIVALDHHEPRILGIEPDAPGRDQPDRPRQQAVLDPMHPILDFVDPRRVGKLDRLLQDDRPAVDALVDEVDGHADQLDPVLERLLDGAHAGEGGQERRVDVDYPALEAADEVRAEQLHEAGQHHQIDAQLLEPVAEGAIPLVAIPVGGELELLASH